jgi:ABC-type phosphate transport system substrate-binding protein
MLMRMRIRMRTLTPLILCLAGAAAPGAAADNDAAASGGFTVIVNVSRPSSIPRQQLADVFLRKSTRWSDGMAITPVDLSVTDATRHAFSKAVLGQTTASVVHYWQQQMFAGRGVPPLVKATPDVLTFVKATPGGIGYVPTGTALPDGVKAVTVTDSAK